MTATAYRKNFVGYVKKQRTTRTSLDCNATQMTRRMAREVTAKTNARVAETKGEITTLLNEWEIDEDLQMQGANVLHEQIAGQTRKRFTNKADMEKYLAGRVKAYAHLFTEISPPIPKEYERHFQVNGQLLPGYTLAGEVAKPSLKDALKAGAERSKAEFAVFYLNPVDRLVKEQLRVKHYIRYMDDFVLLHHSKEYLQECLRQIRALCDALGLTLNAKTQIFPLRAGVDFLGWHFYVTESGKIVRKMRRSTKVRYKRRLAQIQSDYTNGKSELDDVRRVLASYHGHFKHGHAYRLQASCMQSFVLKRNENK